MALIDIFPLDSKTYGFEWLRYILEVAPLQEGVVGTTDFAVTAAAAGGMRVDIAAGTAIVRGDVGTRNAKYIQVNDAAIAPALTFAAAHGSLPRIDQVILQINDSTDLGSLSDTPALEIVTGTATSGATLDNRNGAAALPNNALRLADVLIPAGSSSVTAGNVRDRRPWARGAFYRQIVNWNDYTFTSASFTEIDSTYLRPRIECSGGPVRVHLRGKQAQTGAASRTILGVAVDGTLTHTNGNFDFVEQISGSSPLHFAWDIVNPTVTAGSHRISWQVKTTAPTSTFKGSDADPLEFVVEELVRDLAYNGGT